MNGKTVGRKRPWSNFKVLAQHFPGGTEENHEHRQYSRSLGGDLKPGPPEYEAGVLTTQPRRSVERCYVRHHGKHGWIILNRVL
jgi:hypothetical protein